MRRWSPRPPCSRPWATTSISLARCSPVSRDDTRQGRPRDPRRRPCHMTTISAGGSGLEWGRALHPSPLSPLLRGGAAVAGPAGDCAVDVPEVEPRARALPQEDLALDQTAVGLDRAHRIHHLRGCLLYTSPSPRDGLLSRMPSSA